MFLQQTSYSVLRLNSTSSQIVCISNCFMLIVHKNNHLLWFCHMTYCKPFVTIQNLGQWEFCNYQVISPGNGVFASNFSEKDPLIWRYPPIIILLRWEYLLGTFDVCRKMKSPKSSDYATVIPVCMNYKHMFITGQKHFLKQKMHSLYWKALNKF